MEYWPQDVEMQNAENRPAAAGSWVCRMQICMLARLAVLCRQSLTSQWLYQCLFQNVYSLLMTLHLVYSILLPSLKFIRLCFRMLWHIFVPDAHFWPGTFNFDLSDLKTGPLDYTCFSTSFVLVLGGASTWETGSRSVWAELKTERSGPKIGCSGAWSGRGRKTMERERSAEWEVAERGVGWIGFSQPAAT